MSNTDIKAPTQRKTTRPATSSKKKALTEKIEAALAKAVRKSGHRNTVSAHLMVVQK